LNEAVNFHKASTVAIKSSSNDFHNYQFCFLVDCEKLHSEIFIRFQTPISMKNKIGLTASLKRKQDAFGKNSSKSESNTGVTR